MLGTPSPAFTITDLLFEEHINHRDGLCDYYVLKAHRHRETGLHVFLIQIIPKPQHAVGQLSFPGWIQRPKIYRQTRQTHKHTHTNSQTYVHAHSHTHTYTQIQQTHKLTNTHTLVKLCAVKPGAVVPAHLGPSWDPIHSSLTFH